MQISKTPTMGGWGGGRIAEGIIRSENMTDVLRSAYRVTRVVRGGGHDDDDVDGGDDEQSDTVPVPGHGADVKIT